MEYGTFRTAILTARRERPPLAEPAPDANHDEQTLAARVRRGILRLAAGRIRKLSVTVQGTTIIIEGACGSYYCKQLAQHAAMELAAGQQVDNRLHVD